jgi:aminoglycoside phosphotransferase (APT) family kinase protein
MNGLTTKPTECILDTVSGKVVGKAVNAVLIPPQLDRFASLVGVDVETLDLNVTGWNKFVLLADDRVFLFPRTPAAVEWFERELLAYRALAQTELTVVPRLLGRWEDDTVYPFPFGSCTRLPGRVPDEPEALVEQLGRAIARWHSLDPPDLPGARPPRHHEATHHQWLRRALDATTTAQSAAEAADRLGRPDRLTAWTELLEAAAQLGPVLVHGDIHEDQLLACDGELTGIIDWETVRIDHPFWDFDLSEWGTGLWQRRRQDFSLLRAQAWGSYARERRLSSDARPLETAFRLRDALHLLGGTLDPAIFGTVEEHLAHL